MHSKSLGQFEQMASNQLLSSVMPSSLICYIYVIDIQLLCRCTMYVCRISKSAHCFFHASMHTLTLNRFLCNSFGHSRPATAHNARMSQKLSDKTDSERDSEQVEQALSVSSHRHVHRAFLCQIKKKKKQMNKTCALRK